MFATDRIIRVEPCLPGPDEVFEVPAIGADLIWRAGEEAVVGDDRSSSELRPQRLNLSEIVNRTVRPGGGK